MAEAAPGVANAGGDFRKGRSPTWRSALADQHISGGQRVDALGGQQHFGASSYFACTSRSAGQEFGSGLVEAHSPQEFLGHAVHLNHDGIRHLLRSGAKVFGHLATPCRPLFEVIPAFPDQVGEFVELGATFRQADQFRPEEKSRVVWICTTQDGSQCQRSAAHGNGRAHVNIVIVVLVPPNEIRGLQGLQTLVKRHLLRTAQSAPCGSNRLVTSGGGMLQLGRHIRDGVLRQQRPDRAEHRGWIFPPNVNAKVADVFRTPAPGLQKFLQLVLKTACGRSGLAQCGGNAPGLIFLEDGLQPCVPGFRRQTEERLIALGDFAGISC